MPRPTILSLTLQDGHNKNKNNSHFSTMTQSVPVTHLLYNIEEEEEHEVDHKESQNGSSYVYHGMPNDHKQHPKDRETTRTGSHATMNIAHILE